MRPSLQPYASQVGREAVAVEVAERGVKVVAVGEVCVGVLAISRSTLPWLYHRYLLYLPWL